MQKPIKIVASLAAIFSGCAAAFLPMPAQPSPAPDAVTVHKDITFASQDAPPFLIVHGDHDPIVPVQQSQELAETLKKHGADCSLIIVPGGEHGGFKGKPDLGDSVTDFFTAKLPDAKPVHSSKQPPVYDLAKLVFPDISDTNTAHKSVVVHHIHNDYEPTELTGNMSVAVKSSRLVNNNGRRDMLLEMEVTHKDETDNAWGQETLVALYKLAPKPRLLDVVDLQSDRESGLWDKPAVLSTGNYDCPIYYFSHLNAGEDYFAMQIIELVHDKLVASKASLPLSYSARVAGSDMTESPSLKLMSKANPRQALFTMTMVGKRFAKDSDVVTHKKTNVLTTRLTAVNGRWSCPGCQSMSKQIATLEKKFGFSN